MVKYISPVNILFVSKTSSRRLQDMSSRRFRDMSSRRREDVFSVTIFCLPRRPQDVLRDVFRMSSRRLQDVFARHLQDVLEDEKLLLWGHVEDVFKTCPEDVLKTSWRPTNVCWDITIPMSCTSKSISHMTMISYFFPIIINKFFTNPTAVTLLK